MGEMVDWKMDTFASEYEATDATRCGPDGVSCLRESIHQVWAGTHRGLERLRSGRPDQFL